MRVVLDSNIYISALISGGRALELIQALAQDSALEVFFSRAILEEIVRVLRDKFNWREEDLREAEALIVASGTQVTPSQILNAVPDDPDDNRIVECAIEAAADCIVTGDKDLLRLGTYGDVRILRLSRLMDVMGGQAGGR